MIPRAQTRFLPQIPARAGNTIWIVAAVLSCASVLLLNGRPQFYFDTGGYVDQGNVALMQLGVVDAPAAAGAAATTTGGPESAVKTVDGSRSAFYSLLAGVFSQLGALEGLLAVNAAALFLAVWLLPRVMQRLYGPDASRVALICFPLIAASLGSLPFFTAFLMPDLLAPVMILSIAMLTAFARDMRRWELGLAFGIGAFAIVSHLSHFAIAGLMLLASVLISVLVARRRWWVGPLMVVAILGAAYAQQSAFRLMARAAAKSEVVIWPYITARLVQDGPGLRYLENHCPDAAIPTCKLYEALSWSDDPYRLTASHIVFETSKRLGSFRLMPAADQKTVSDAQVGFFVDVLTDMPVATTLAFVSNALLQSSMVSVDMTLPSDKIVARNARVTGALSGPLAHGRLSADTGWLGFLTQVQRIYYVSSLALVLSLLALPRSVPVAVKAFAVMILLGILANALVCGGISQPATRYGSRVIWLLPFVAAVLAFWAVRGGKAQG